MALPEDFTSVESTMRSREIYVSIILQNLAQVKALFKDTWETVLGNCDVIIYLGGNEPSSHEYISKMLGKQTIDKQSSSESKGKSGSSSKSNDVMGRDLMMPDEVRKLHKKKCLVFISGEDPIIDYKYKSLLSKAFLSAKMLGSYIHRVSIVALEKVGETIELVEFLNEKSLHYYKRLQDNGGNVEVYKFSLEEFLCMTESTFYNVLPEREYSKEKEDQEKRALEIEENLKGEQKEGINQVLEYLVSQSLSSAQMEQIQLGYKNGISDADIMKYVDVNNSSEKMKEMRLLLEMDLEIQ